MALVRFIVSETGGVDEDAREVTSDDTLICKGIENPDDDLVLTSSTQILSLNTAVSTLDTLDSNKDNGVAGFDKALMNNLSLYNQIGGAGQALGPVTYPIPMSRTVNSSDFYLEWGTGVASEDIPWTIPFNARSLAITSAVRVATRWTLVIYKNLNLTTPIYTKNTGAVGLSFYFNIGDGDPGHFDLVPGDRLTFRLYKDAAATNLRDPTMTLWLQNSAP